MRIIYASLITLILSAGALTAQSMNLDYAHVLEVQAEKQPDGWRFDVTVRHGDEGWDHYADLWLVVDTESGEEYGRRVLAHPHVSEQPFTRSQSGIKIPEDVSSVLVKAACNVHGFGGTEMTVELR